MVLEKCGRGQALVGQDGARANVAVVEGDPQSWNDDDVGEARAMALVQTACGFAESALACDVQQPP